MLHKRLMRKHSSHMPCLALQPCQFNSNTLHSLCKPPSHILVQLMIRQTCIEALPGTSTLI